MRARNSVFASAVERFPGRTALLVPADDGSIVSYPYAELQAKVYKFTGYLQEQHFVKGQRIMLGAPSRVDWMVALLGTLLAGRVMVPLDNNSKEHFIDRIAPTTQPPYLIPTRKQQPKLPHSPLTLIAL